LIADKSFTSEQEAWDFVAGKPVVSKSASGEPDKFYGVAVGHNPGVYLDWREAQAQVTDIKGPKYKKFETRAQAEEFVRTKGASWEVGKAKAEGSNSNTTEEPNTKRIRVSAAAKNKSKIKVQQVYTDGSSRGNGRAGARAGVGVYFGEDDFR
jgi:ribonuclease HI